MTPAAQTTVADLLEALAATVRTAPTFEERFLSLDVVARRLALVDDAATPEQVHSATEYVRKKLRNQLPIVKLGRRLVVRERDLGEFIRRRAARGTIRAVNRRSA